MNANLRISKLEEVERARLSAAIDAKFEEYTEDELRVLADPSCAELDALTDEQLEEMAARKTDRDGRVLSIAELQTELNGLTMWLDDYRAAQMRAGDSQ